MSPPADVARDGRIPRGPRVLATVLVVIGLAASITLYVAPGAIITDLVVDRSPIRMASDMVAGRSIAQAVLLAIALWSGSRIFLLGAFVMRFLTELGDLYANLHAGAPVALDAFQVLVLVAELWAIAVLYRAGRAVSAGSAPREGST